MLGPLYDEISFDVCTRIFDPVHVLSIVHTTLPYLRTSRGAEHTWQQDGRTGYVRLQKVSGPFESFSEPIIIVNNFEFMSKDEFLLSLIPVVPF